ncbi:MAG: hypothetical protein ACO3RU_10995 [Planctomycetota bacterium]
MRKFALLLPLALLGACSSWNNASNDGTVTVADVQSMASDYDRVQKWRAVSRTMDGRTNALSRDLGRIGSTINRHLFNYSSTDPYVNYETDENYFSTTFYSLGSGILTNVMPWVPGL